jgi:hypothetical protein
MTDKTASRLAIWLTVFMLFLLTFLSLYQADVIDLQRTEMKKLLKQNTEYANQIIRNHCQDPAPSTPGPQPTHLKM